MTIDLGDQEKKSLDDIHDIGSIIRTKRKQKRLTQAELAELSGISIMSIRRYEKNERRPGISEMIKLGKALGFQITFDAELSSEIHGVKLDDNWPETLVNMGKEHQKLDDLVRLYSSLNDEGKKKALEFLNMLTHVQEYVAEGGKQ